MCDIVSYLLGKNAGGGSPTPPSLQEKNVTITENTTTNVLPDIGYDGLSKVSITTNVPSGTTEPKTVDELRNITTNFGLYLSSLLNNYEAYTNEAITIYTPDSECTNFMIQKRTGNKYRIVWGKTGNTTRNYVALHSNTSQTFTNITCYVRIPNTSGYEQIVYHDFLEYNFDMAKSGDLAFGNFALSYYSNEFSSLEDLITNLKSSTGNITYTKYTSALGFSGILDDNWKTPITNVPMFESDYSTPVINGKVLSHNLTILPRE